MTSSLFWGPTRIEHIYPGPALRKIKTTRKTRGRLSKNSLLSHDENREFFDSLNVPGLIISPVCEDD